MWAGLALLSQDPSLTLADSWSYVLGSRSNSQAVSVRGGGVLGRAASVLSQDL